MHSISLIQWLGAILFALAVLHTFSTKFFNQLAARKTRHAGVWHLLGEVEVVFGVWAMILVLFLFLLNGKTQALGYLESLNFTEPMFVFAIMVVAGTRPILWVVGEGVRRLSRLFAAAGHAYYFLLLSLVPLLGSFITEPAAMTLAALMLRDSLFQNAVSNRLRYATLGVLFVNVSIGGTLTHFAAPPVLMVAHTWGWDMSFMFMTFGWKAMVAVVLNAAIASWLFRHELGVMGNALEKVATPISYWVVGMHLLFLLLIVMFAHYPVMFLGVFLFFMGYVSAYARQQERLILREALLVAFFLAGLVVLGGQQQWWLEPVLMSMSADAVFYGATALTAITDNAALTYLGSLVEGLTDEFKVALVAGAVSGGGLTVIANAPNPAGLSILRGRFEGGVVNPLFLLLGALYPTLIAILAFRLL
ncbi:MAG: putative Na+/H+ antiporter [Pigmentiphaga sp.]|nr:putative Na+/H+ antiporter [Pigmentiphaga sp.]